MDGSPGKEISSFMPPVQRLPLYCTEQGSGDHAGQQALSLGSGFPGDDSAGGAPPADAASPPPALTSPPASPATSPSPSQGASTSPAAAPTPVPAPAPGPAASNAPHTRLHPWHFLAYKLERCPCITTGGQCSACCSAPARPAHHLCLESDMESACVLRVVAGGSWGCDAAQMLQARCP